MTLQLWSVALIPQLRLPSLPKLEGFHTGAETPASADGFAR